MRSCFLLAVVSASFSLSGCSLPGGTCEPLQYADERADRFPALSGDEEAVLFLGDILLSEAGGTAIERCGVDWPLSGIAPIIASAQAVAVVGNHEGPITSVQEEHGPNRWNYGAPPFTVDALAAAGFTHLSLANNHALDRGLAGLSDTLAHIEGAGIEPFGAGGDLDEAARAARITVGGAELAIVGALHPYAKYRLDGWGATLERGGLLLLQEAPLSVAFEAAADADYRLFYPHWGDTYTGLTEGQQADASLAMDLGFDAIVGHHSHNAQQASRVGEGAVLWSLGNAAFGTRGSFGDEHGHGLIARLVMAGGELLRFDVLPIRVNNRKVDFRAEPCPVEEAQQVLEGLTSGFEPSLISGGVAVLPL